jgi:NAD(P)-dependent dehydrogenase (short-subunit alcohol dehydrogenase family)/acyl carrier protein
LAVMRLIQSLPALDSPVPVWIVTRGAQSVGAAQESVSVAQAPVWGIGRVIGHQEYVKYWGGAVDLDPAAPATDVALLAQAVQSRDDEDQIAFRDGRRYVVRLVRSEQPLAALAPRFRADSSYLITGGSGALGILTAQWMVEKGARHLILMARTPLPPRSQWHQVLPGSPHAERIAAVRRLEAMGATVHNVAVDVTDEAELNDFLQRYQDEGWPPVRGVIHSAGQVQDQLLNQMDAATFCGVTRPKVLGSWALHRAFKDTPLDFFILFSSVASLVAQTGQANYASGNAFLDALAAYRRSQGLPALAINWGPWAVGMIKDLDLIEHYARRGMASITAEVGVGLLEGLFGYEKPQVAVVDATWPLVLEYYPRIPQQVKHLGEEAAEAADPAEPQSETIIQRFLRTDSAGQLPLIQKHLTRLLAKVLRIDAGKLEAEAPLSALGMDSLIATELRNRIELQLEVNVSVVELLQGATIARLAERAVQQLQARVLQEAAVAELLADDAQISIEALHELAQEVDEATLLQLIQEVENVSQD